MISEHDENMRNICAYANRPLMHITNRQDEETKSKTLIEETSVAKMSARLK